MTMGIAAGNKNLNMNSPSLPWFTAFLLLQWFSSFTVLHAQSAPTLVDTDFSGTFKTGDELFLDPYIDVDEIRTAPQKHRYVHGGFRGTATRFSFYFPEKEKYNGRFFQYITPFPDNENLSQGAIGEEDKIGFAVSHGAYFVETNGGGAIDFANPGANDPTIGAWRANAASAGFSRVVAQKIFGGERPYGYAFGGSGGAYRTIGGAENTEGIWDGVVPYVVGSPMAIPNVFAVRMHAMRILKDKFPQIIDALEPGGSGDMYAGLNDEEKAALEEVTQMGFPPQSWFGYENMGIHGFLVLYQGVVMADNKYFTEDFWHKPGYLGADPPESLVKARLSKVTKISASIDQDEAVRLGLREAVSEEERGTADKAWTSMGGKAGGMPAAFRLTDIMPDVDFLGGDLIIRSGEAAGRTLQLTKVQGDKVALGPTNAPDLLFKIRPGDEVQVDNSNFLAVQTYHRHQVPGPEYTVWDQFRDADGNPLYPQRPMLLGPLFTRGASGVVPNGNFKGKMIMLCSLWDREAFPWQGDWYRSQAKKHLGTAVDDNYRLWYTDRALHGDEAGQEDPSRTVSYLGVLQQALLDLSDWVERGIAPSPSTNYTIENGQVIVPESAIGRAGIQPVAALTVKGKKRADITAGKRVKFKVEMEVPVHTGEIVGVEWDFDGDGTFEQSSTAKKGKAKVRHQFDHPGTYFTTVRVSSQRRGDVQTPYTRIYNLDRVRIVVK